MRREFMFGTIIAAALAVSVGAQQPSQDRSPSGPSGGRTVTVTGCLTSAGAPGAAEPGAAPSAQPGAGAQSGFILTNGTMGSGSSGTGTSGTAPGSPSAGAATTPGATMGSTDPATARSFRLSGGGQGLQQYMNSRVEVIGTLQSTGSSTSGSTGRTGSPAEAGTSGTATGTSTRPGSTTGSSAGSSTAGGAGTGAGAGTGNPSGTMAGQTGGDQPMQMLRVTSVKQVSGSCSGEGR